MRLRKYGFTCIVCDESRRFWTRKALQAWRSPPSRKPSFHHHISQEKWDLIRRLSVEVQ